MTTGQLQLGAVEVVSRGADEVIGYAYTVENGAGQLQRWLLYRNPQNAFGLRPAPSPMSDWTLAAWQAKVAELWRPESFYVWAQATLYRHGGTYDGKVWTRIPPASELPLPTYPPVPRAPFQLDPTGVKPLDVIQGSLKGLAYSVGGLEDASSVEYWMLPQAYAPAGVKSKTEIATGSNEASSLQAFIDAANQGWSLGCIFAITGCVNYTGKVAPEAA